MMRLVLEIASRFSRSLRSNGFARFATAVSVGSVAVGTIALILAISILNGYEEAIERTALRFIAHVEARPLTGESYASASALINVVSGIGGVASVDASLSREALLRTRHGVDGVVLTGIGKDRARQHIDPLIVRGSGVGANGVVIGERLADMLRANVGDTVVLYASDEERTRPIIGTAHVRGILRSGMERYDNALVVMPIEDLRTFLRLSTDAASNLLITCRSTDQAEAVAARVRSTVGPTSYVTTFRDTFQAMVSWIEIQKRPIPIVLGLISLVAVFSVISTLLIAVVEKTRSMAILITLGMTPQRIMGIVLARAVSIGVLGSIIGTAVAYAALWAQRTWQIVRLDGAIYYVRDVPVSLAPEPFVLIPAISISLCILVSIVPMVIASRVRPARALRF